MPDDDLIRRGDVLGELKYLIGVAEKFRHDRPRKMSYALPERIAAWETAISKIRAIPAAEPCPDCAGGET